MNDSIKDIIEQLDDNTVKFFDYKKKRYVIMLEDTYLDIKGRGK